MSSDLLAPWVLTYLLHSTLLLGVAWLAVRTWRRMPVPLQESLWRTALFGGVLTASAHLAIGWEPWSGRFDVPQLEGQAPVPAAPLPGERMPTLDPVVAPDDEAVLALLPVAPAKTPAATEPALRPDPGTLLGGLWLAGLLLLLVRSQRARRRLRRRLAARQPVEARPLLERLDALRRAAGVRRAVRLSTSTHVGSPVAVGVRRAEIVVPARATRELSPAQQEVMLAHELAHHVRHDPLWLALTRAVCSLLFFQPLNHLAARRLRDASELLCDAWAAERTGRGRELAECLTKIAGWMLGSPPTAPAHAMAAEGSMLKQRVERLLHTRARETARRHRTAGLLAVVPLAAVAVFAPVVARDVAAAPAGPASQDGRYEVPVDDTQRALALLDAEIAELDNELGVLIDLLRQVPQAPEALRRGAARLEARLAALETRRTAIARTAKESTR